MLRIPAGSEVAYTTLLQFATSIATTSSVFGDQPTEATEEQPNVSGVSKLVAFEN